MFFPTFGYWAKLFGPPAVFSTGVLLTAFYVSMRIFWRKFVLRNFKVFSRIRILSKLFRIFGNKLSAELPKLHSTCPEENFEVVVFYEKKNFILSTLCVESFSKFDDKKWKYCENNNFVSMATLWDKTLVHVSIPNFWGIFALRS